MKSEKNISDLILSEKCYLLFNERNIEIIELLKENKNNKIKVKRDRNFYMGFDFQAALNNTIIKKLLEKTELFTKKKCEDSLLKQAIMQVNIEAVSLSLKLGERLDLKEKINIRVSIESLNNVTEILKLLYVAHSNVAEEKKFDINSISFTTYYGIDYYTIEESQNISKLEEIEEFKKGEKVPGSEFEEIKRKICNNKNSEIKEYMGVPRSRIESEELSENKEKNRKIMYVEGADRIINDEINHHEKRFKKDLPGLGIN